MSTETLNAVCPHCEAVNRIPADRRDEAPQFEQAARRLAGQVQFAKVDTDAEPELAGRFGIRSIPTLVLMKDGREVRRASGAMSAAQLEQWLGAA